MANTYDVAPADISNELPGLFPYGFATADAPVTLAMVTTFIATADTMVTLRIKQLTGAAPLNSDDAAPIAKQYVINWVLAKIIRIVYTGQDAAADFASPYSTSADAAWNLLTTLGDEDTGTVIPPGPSAADFPVISSFRISDGPTDEYARPVDFPIGNV